jgi:hypothetical protein
VRQQADAQGVLADGQGRWLLTADFLSPAVRQAVAPALPAEDVIRYRFGDQEVTLRPVAGGTDTTDPDCAGTGSQCGWPTSYSARRVRASSSSSEVMVISRWPTVR